jgi:hypothetical protein
VAAADARARPHRGAGRPDSRVRPARRARGVLRRGARPAVGSPGTRSGAAVGARRRGRGPLPRRDPGVAAPLPVADLLPAGGGPALRGRGPPGSRRPAARVDGAVRRGAVPARIPGSAVRHQLLDRAAVAVAAAPAHPRPGRRRRPGRAARERVDPRPGHLGRAAGGPARRPPVPAGRIRPKRRRSWRASSTRRAGARAPGGDGQPGAAARAPARSCADLRSRACADATSRRARPAGDAARAGSGASGPAAARVLRYAFRRRSGREPELSRHQGGSVRRRWGAAPPREGAGGRRAPDGTERGGTERGQPCPG